MKHYSVMKDTVLEYLNIKDDGVYVDATLGYAGHSKEILKRIKKGRLFAFDADRDALSYSHQSLLEVGENFCLIHSNFINLEEELDKVKVPLVDGFLFDLGLSSPEIDDASRGFSFMHGAELDMRMDRSKKLNAKDIVNNYSKEAINKANYMCKVFEDTMKDGCINGIAEIFDGDFASTGRGCYTQAWSVAELLRAYTQDVMPYLNK